MLETSHRPTSFNKLNTGIYQREKLRAISEVDEQSKTSSTYTVYAYNFEHVQETLLTDKPIFGTNMLGFRQGISASDSLAVYLDFIDYGVTLKCVDADYSFSSNISAYRY